MRNSSIAIIALAIYACTYNSTPEVSNSLSYGEKIAIEGAVPVSGLVKKLKEQDSVHLKVTGEILATCKKKGCWMKVALPDGEEMRVTFKNYGFFVPTEGIEGKRTVIEGIARKMTTDVETLKPLRN